MTTDRGGSSPRLTTREDVHDFINGTNLLSGSGGSPQEARDQLEATLDEGHALTWVDVDTLADDALVVSTFFHGATDPESWQQRSAREAERKLTRVHPRPLEVAVSRLEDLLGRQCDAIIPIEIGASNTAAALDVGARLGRPVLDADYAGRAVPSFECILPAVYDAVAAPLVMADYYGDVVEVTRTANVSMLETIGKMTALATLGRIGSAGLPLTGAQVKQIAARRTLTDALEAGRALRRARAAGGDIVRRLCADLAAAEFLFEGVLVSTDRIPDPGYMAGMHLLTGTGSSSGRQLSVYFKNENHIAWLDGELLISSPDVIEIVDRSTAEPLVNSDPIDREIAVIGLRARPEWTRPQAIDVLSPQQWGYDLPYRPFVAPNTQGESTMDREAAVHAVPTEDSA